MDKTTLFEIEDITNALIETTLDEIYDALKEKGYNPISQISISVMLLLNL